MYPDFQSAYDITGSNHNHTNIDDVSIFDPIHDYLFVFFFVFLNGFRRFNFLEDNDFVFDF